MALAYGVAGDDAKMIALLKEVAAAKPVNTWSNIMDASNTRNHAHEVLGHYYMKKRDWKEAMAWWEKWQPSSWCRTCAEAMQKQRQANIEECKKNLSAGR